MVCDVYLEIVLYVAGLGGVGHKLHVRHRHAPGGEVAVVAWEGSKYMIRLLFYLYKYFQLSRVFI